MIMLKNEIIESDLIFMEKNFYKGYKILKGNTKTNPEIIVMSKISESSDISALSDLPCDDDGAISVYNDFVKHYIIIYQQTVFSR